MTIDLKLDAIAAELRGLDDEMQKKVGNERDAAHNKRMNAALCEVWEVLRSYSSATVSNDLNEKVFVILGLVDNIEAKTVLNANNKGIWNELSYVRGKWYRPKS